MHIEATQRNQLGLALKDPNDGLLSDSGRGGCLDERLRSSDNFDPIFESRVSSEGDQVVVNSHKGKGMLWNKL